MPISRKIYLLIVMMTLVFLNPACMRVQSRTAGQGSQNGVVLSSSLKTADGKVVNAKNQTAASPSGAGVSQGKCVYGCPDPVTVERKSDEKTASLEGPSGTPSISSSSSSSPINGIPPDYILGSEDIIDVSVWKNDNLSKTVLIRPDGKISLPLIGDVQAAGLTTSELRDSIKSKLKEYKETPEVSIIVKEINSFVVFVTGEVTRPGKLMLKSDTSLLQAVSLAGGFTQYASTNKIILLRRVGGVETRKIIRYKDIVSGKKPEDDILLQRGDTIVVP